MFQAGPAWRPGAHAVTGPAWNMPASTTPSNRAPSPTKPATKALAGRSDTSTGSPTCSIRPWLRIATRSASSSASSWSWVTKMVVTPVASWIRRSSRRRDLRTAASSAPNGSSSSSTLGSTASARARATLCLCPPDSCEGKRLPSSPSSTSCSRSCTRLATAALSGRSLDFFTSRPKATFLATLMCLNRAYCWNTKPTWRSAAPAQVTSCPSNSTWPLSGNSSPAMVRSRVVLPEPEGPSRARSSPGRMSRLTPLSAG